jgi:replicative DNA helicase
MTTPSSPESEKAFLSAALQNNSILDIHADHLKEGLFFSRANKAIFKAVVEMWKEGNSCDLVTISAWLEKNNLMDEAGGNAYLADVYTYIPTSALHDQYITELRHYHTARLAIAGAERIIASARNPAMEGDLSETVQKTLVSIAAEAESATKIEPIRESAKRRVDEYEFMVKNRGKLMGYTYGIKPLDDHTGGMRPGQLIVIGGATKSGKTALALNIAQRTANSGNGVGIFSLEMSAGELIDRLVASYRGVDVSVLSKEPSQKDMTEIRFGINQISELPIWIRDESSINPLQIMAATRRMVATHNIKVIVFDYIQLATPQNSKDSRERQVADISRCLKLVAKELKIAVVALTQLNADGYSRESRAIEHDADLFLALRHDKEDGCFLDIRLGRNCSRASFPMEFRPQYLRFDSREA